MTKILAIAIAGLLLSATSASSVGFLTQMSCASDYYAYCSKFQVGSKELRLCMRRAGPKLSKSCLNALIADGEVSKAEVERTRQEILAAKNAAKQSPAEKQKSEEPKQKRTAVAKADNVTSSIAPRSHSEKKAKESDVPRKSEKLTINEQTFAALKQRRPKFIEEAAAEEVPAPREPERAKSAVDQTASVKGDDPRDELNSKGHKKKSAKKAKSEPQTSNKKSKAKLAAKKEKQRSQKRKRLARE